ncbi:hypothetical protein DQ04_00361230 [Trypanosoma grayi]|uniref:hypothetical protein n=1 Tax=Trypanosoma grayi TaxID=71804 RepID=UPI0004F40663|nr:hypothetical protein DQ04_00361230 [Trypanosoma grayi]KEG14661.1 hypothetical protein DQ04_00361230 [Trypanosoma grayi]
MGSKRTSKRAPASTATNSKTEEETKIKPQERPSPSVSEEPKPEFQEDPLPELQQLPPSNAPEPQAQLSKRALKRMRGWEPVIKPPDDTDALPPSVVPTADVVWLDNTTSVTLIPNSSSGVHTRRGAASLAAVSPPTSYLVYTRDPLIKMGKAGQQNVHVITTLPPGGDPRSLLHTVPSMGSLTQRSSATAAGASNTGSSSSSSLKAQEETKCEGESDEERGEDDADTGNSSTVHSRSRRRSEAGSSARPRKQSNETESEKRKKSGTAKKADETSEATTPTIPRAHGLSAAQAMLPPPYRRNRRLKRKLHITDETPVFATHSELRNTVPQIFQKAPFSTEEDVLRSILDWRDDPALVYARLLWEFSPDEFLCRVMQKRADTAAAAQGDPRSSSNV